MKKNTKKLHLELYRVKFINLYSRCTENLCNFCVLKACTENCVLESCTKNKFFQHLKKTCTFSVFEKVVLRICPKVKFCFLCARKLYKSEVFSAFFFVVCRINLEQHSFSYRLYPRTLQTKNEILYWAKKKNTFISRI